MTAPWARANPTEGDGDAGASAGRNLVPAGASAPLRVADTLAVDELWKAVRARWWVIAGGAVAGAALGLLAARVMPKRFESTASVVIGPSVLRAASLGRPGSLSGRPSSSPATNGARTDFRLGSQEAAAAGGLGARAGNDTSTDEQGGQSDGAGTSAQSSARRELLDANVPATGDLTHSDASNADEEEVVGTAAALKMEALLESEIQVLTSRRLVGLVVDSLRLQATVLGTSAPASSILASLSFPGSFEPIAVHFVRAPAGYRAVIGTDTIPVTPGRVLRLGGGSLVLRPGRLPDGFALLVISRDDAIVGTIRKISVAKAGGHVVKVAFRAHDPATAAAVPNLLIENYRAYRRDLDRERNGVALVALQAQYDSTGVQLRRAESDLARAQTAAGALDPAVLFALRQGRADDLRRGKAELDGTRAMVAAALQKVRAGRMSPRQLAAPGLIDQRSVDALLKQATDLETERSRRLADLSPRHPEIVALDSAIANIDGELIRLTEAYLLSLDHESAVMAVQLDSAQRSMSTLPAASQSILGLKRDTKLLSDERGELEREIMGARLAAMNEGGDVRLLDAAKPPRLAMWSQPKLLAGLAAAAGTLGALTLVLFAGLFRRRLDEPAAIERIHGVRASVVDASSEVLLPADQGRTVLVIPLDGARADAVMDRITRGARVRGQTVAIVDLCAETQESGGVDSAIELRARIAELDATYDVVLVRLSGVNDERMLTLLDPRYRVLLVSPGAGVRSRELQHALAGVRQFGAVPVDVVIDRSTVAAHAIRPAPIRVLGAEWPALSPSSIRLPTLLQAALLLLIIANLGRIPLITDGERSVPVLVNDLVIAAFLLCAALAMAAVRRVRVNTTAALALAFATLGALSAVAGIPRFGLSVPEVLLSLAYLVRWLFYFAVYVAVLNTVRARDVEAVWGALENAIVLFAGFGIVQAAFIPGFAQKVYPDSNPYVDWDPQGHRLVSTFLDPNFAGAFIAIGLLIMLARLSVGARANGWKMLVLGVALVLTASRSSILAFMVGAGVLLMTRGLSRRVARALGVAALLALLALPKALAFARAYNKLHISDASALARVTSWLHGLEVFRDHPIIGIGFNTWGYVQERYGWQRSFAATYGIDGGLLFIATMTGVIGLALYLGMLGSIVRSARRLWRDATVDAGARGLAIGAAATIPAIVVHSLFTNSLMLPYLMEPLWVVWALVAVVALERPAAAAAPVEDAERVALPRTTTVLVSGA